MHTPPQYNKRAIVVFLLTYLCVLVPFLLVSILITRNTTDKLNTQVHEKVVARMEKVQNELDDLQDSYFNKSLELANDTDLLYNKMKDPIKAYSSLKTLQTQLTFDSYASNFLLYYGDQMLYTEKGYSKLSVFLENTLSIQPEYTNTAYDIIERKEYTSYLLERNENEGYVVLHYPARIVSYSRGASSVDFLFSYRQFENIIASLADNEHTYIKISFRNGHSLCFLGTLGKVQVLPRNEYPADDGEYISEKVEMDKFEAELEVLYKADEIYGVVKNAQTLNYILFACALFLSTIISIIISNRRVHQLNDLADDIKSGFDAKTSSQKGLEYMFFNQTLKNAILDKNTKIEERERHIQRQTAYMLFHGIIVSREMLNQLLKPCGIELFEDYFSVGAIIFDNNSAAYSRVCEFLKNDLFYEDSDEGKHIFYFIIETAEPDPAQRHRMEFARNLYQILSGIGCNDIRVGISRVYDNITMTGLAYQEAQSIVEKMIAGTILNICAIWEQIEPRPASFMHISEDNRLAFTEALDKRDCDAAIKAFHKIKNEMNVNDISKENQNYFRYQIIRILVNGQESNDQLIENTMNTAFTSNEFSADIERIIRQFYSGGKQDQKFDAILEYIQAHYQESSLSAEEVASMNGVDKTHLSRMFRSKINMSYIEYLTNLRMGKACELLITTNMSVQEICTEVGYIDISSFRKKFKALYNLSLSEFREANISNPKGNDNI